MLRAVLTAVLAVAIMGLALTPATAGEVEVLGVKFATEKEVAGRILKLNGVGYRKAFGFIKVYVVGLYLENPTGDPEEIINSEQVKHMVTHYLTGKATAKKLKAGFIEEITGCNPPEQVARQKANIDLYASWLDKDMKPGLTSVSTYVPGKGLTLEYQGQIKGTIADPEFARMYYRYNVGPKARKTVRQGLLGK